LAGGCLVGVGGRVGEVWVRVEFWLLQSWDAVSSFSARERGLSGFSGGS